DGQKGPRYTTRQALEEEKDTDRRLHAGKSAHMAVMTEREFNAALQRFEARKGFALSDEQRAAAKMILCGSDRFQGVQGLAGTGKTTALEFVREAAESRGWRVVGHSNGSEQAATMQRESGITTTTTASHLIAERQALAERGRDLDTRAPAIRELRIMDEASMAGQRAFRDVVRTTEASGARTVFLGDSRQHQSVERGRAFERAQAHMPMAVLGEQSIRRQKTAELKAAVADVLHKREAAALARLQTREIAPARAALPAGASREELRAAARQDNAAVIAQIAKDYAALDAKTRANTLVLTSTNSDRKALNHAIRQELQRAGALGQDAAQATVLRAADMTKADAKRAASYSAGQVVEVTTGKGAERQTVRYTVERADARANVLHVRDTQGHARIIDLHSRPRITAYDAEQRGIVAGDRMRFTENHLLPDGTKVRNGQVATIERIDGDRVTLRLGDGPKAQTVQADLRALKADHDYAVTSYSSQGRTVDAVMIHHNTEAAGHNSREVYVNITRAREDVTLYTQDTEKMARQAGLEQTKTAAHDLVQQQQPRRDTGVEMAF
ncbi:AAA family ATPase, partial [Thiomonas sp.]|uniref:AAA family ATPase n=1 Tax=Thiomonas sp. TaxID=2047785 RepID=UPI00262564DE